MATSWAIRLRQIDPDEPDRLPDDTEQGEILLLGQSTRGMERHQLARLRREHIGFVFQQFNLLARTSLSTMSRCC